MNDSSHEIKQVAPIQNRTPPTAPSTVFLGLISGQSLCLPKNVPAKKAPISAIHGRPSAIRK